jgi:hypothetical protein
MANRHDGAQRANPSYDRDCWPEKRLRQPDSTLGADGTALNAT